MSWERFLSVCFLFMMLILALQRVWRRFEYRRRDEDEHWHRHWSQNRTSVTHSLRRGGFSEATRRQAQIGFARAQLVGLGQSNPSDEAADNAADIFRGEILSHRGAEFHLRHVEADNFLRRAVQHVMNSPLVERIAAVRAVFEAMNAQHLIAIWEEISNRLLNSGRNGNWYQQLGARRVDELRRGLNNTTGQLFYSESQGNLMTGTHVDVTGDALAVLSPSRVESVVRAGTNLMESLNLMPRLVMVESEILLGYTGSSGAYREFGFDPRRSHDRPIDPLRLLNRSQSLRAMSRSDLRVVLRYLLRYHPCKTMGALLLILYGIWHQVGLPMINWE